MFPKCIIRDRIGELGNKLGVGTGVKRTKLGNGVAEESVVLAGIGEGTAEEDVFFVGIPAELVTRLGFWDDGHLLHGHAAGDDGIVFGLEVRQVAYMLRDVDDMLGTE